MLERGGSSAVARCSVLIYTRHLVPQWDTGHLMGAGQTTRRLIKNGYLYSHWNVKNKLTKLLLTSLLPPHVESVGIGVCKLYFYQDTDCSITQWVIILLPTYNVWRLEVLNFDIDDAAFDNILTRH